MSRRRDVRTWPRAAVRAVIGQIPRMAAIAAGALGVALAVNTVHPMQLPLVANGPAGLPRRIMRQFHHVNVDKAQRLIKKPQVVVVDTRDVGDFRDGHIAGAISLPYHGFEEQYRQFHETVTKDTPLLLYCYGSSCGLSARVGKRLIARGYEDVTILRGGIAAWKAARLPLERPEDDGGE